jgi:hypothetical protein
MQCSKEYLAIANFCDERTDRQDENNMVWFMVLNATFNNISVIAWWLGLLVEETGVPGENH